MRDLVKEFDTMMESLPPVQELKKEFLIEKIKGWIEDITKDWLHTDDVAEFCVNMGITL
jgi:hypothetical protein